MSLCSLPKLQNFFWRLCCLKGDKQPINNILNHNGTLENCVEAMETYTLFLAQRSIVEITQ